MVLKINKIICGITLLVFLLTGTSASTDSTRVPFTSTIRDVKGEPSIVFISDIQSPLWFEKLALKSDNNEEATQFMLDNIGHDTSVAALFLLGDMAALGSFSSYWDDVYNKTTAVRNARIPVFPTFGNHEYQPIESKGKEHFYESFPYIKSDWYSKRIRNIGIIILNSNFSKLDDNKQKEQQKWYQETIKKFDDDSAVSIVIVGCHHSPYTNSNIVSPSSEVQTFFVKPFLHSTKAKVFLSGHSHAYEHFRVSDKDFFVIGGGGGLLHPLLQSKEQRFRDISSQKSARGFFHYIRFILSPNKLKMQVIRPSTNRMEFQIINVYEISLN